MRLLPAQLRRALALAAKVRPGRALAADLYAAAGIGLIALGIYDIYRPAAFIVTGLFLLVYAFGTSRRPA